ncbi:MAG: SIMPL domain-containing protein [Planctomycetota bacterium]|nr:SIMPL domain-containing protein [Planctomycetota bacterium]
MAEYRIRLLAFNTAVVIAMGIVVSVVTSTIVASNAYRSKFSEAQKAQQSIVVKGKATKRVRSDRGKWWITVNGTGESIQKAHTVLESGISKVNEYLNDCNFSEEEITRGPISTRVHYDRDEKGKSTRKIVEYELSQHIRVSTIEVDKIASAAGEVTDLLKDGIFVIGGTPQYTYSGVSDVKIQILAEAASNARKRADEVSTKAGGSVKDIRDIRQGVIQITTPDSTKVTSYGVNDTSTIMKDVSVVVTVEFGIEDR